VFAVPGQDGLRPVQLAHAHVFLLGKCGCACLCCVGSGGRSCSEAWRVLCTTTARIGGCPTLCVCCAYPSSSGMCFPFSGSQIGGLLALIFFTRLMLFSCYVGGALLTMVMEISIHAGVANWVFIGLIVFW
jgi:hypothetical protein